MDGPLLNRGRSSSRALTSAGAQFNTHSKKAKCNM